MSGSFRIETTVTDPANDSAGRGVLHDLQDFGLTNLDCVRAVNVYTFAGKISADDAKVIASSFLADPIVDSWALNKHVLASGENDRTHSVEILRKPGVMDPAENSVRKGLAELGFAVDWVRTARRFVVTGEVAADTLKTAALKVLANEVIEEVEVNAAPQVTLPAVGSYTFTRGEVALAGLDAAALEKLSLSGQLYLTVPEMKAIQQYFAERDRVPTDIELETIAQTWSEHCVHKTMKGKIRYRDAATGEEELIDNLLKETVAKVTHELDKPWCLSVFVDNAGVIEFDDTLGVAFKAETHNHPSAIEPYGGAGTGIGGCIRDPLGTGLGAKAVLNTNVFCLGEPNTPQENVPRGALHPRRVLKGVVGGVRDYGNRMGIPTANGALYFDERYIGNPLVFCGNIALIPQHLATKRTPTPGQVGLVVGGRTGRDGIHGATFSSVELDEDSEMVSSGAVQIGNPIEEKKVLDFILRARDAGLYTCITDCGAGGLSSALGEMGETCGVEVDLDQVPLKYAGLSYTEIWISEAQERMVISADEAQLPALFALAKEEDVEVTVIAKFRDDRQLILRYDGEEVASLEMEFLHDGVPQIEREAVWVQPELTALTPSANEDYAATLKKILGAWNVCSKEWIIRQYDHEVQANSVVKPLVGIDHDGPGDAAVIAPVPGSTRGLAVACGMNPKYSDLDPYHMAASAIDEALRNIVAVGGSLERCAILDNFCWGNCDKPDRLAGLVRAAKACYDIAKVYGVPFISGKDSLNNEFTAGGETIVIPGTLLISALSVMPDVRLATTMDCKTAGNHLYIIGETKNELGGSHYAAAHGAVGDNVPKVEPVSGLRVLQTVSAATATGLIRAAHDCSEGGIAVAAAEMAFAGGLGLTLQLDAIPTDAPLDSATLLFSESNSRLLLEIAPEKIAAFESLGREREVPFACLGTVTADSRFVVNRGDSVTLSAELADLKRAWQTPLAL